MSERVALQAAVEGFLRYVQVERQLSPLTHENYARQLAVLTEQVSEMNLTDWTQLEPAHVRSL
ncbi:MAG: site-specific integrase, partial [Pantoea sp.]|nr:site-specific integrase [Pantoea sp.]